MSESIINAGKRLVTGHPVVRYAITGALATVVHYGIYYLLMMVRMPLEASYATGWAVSLAFNFWMTGWFTFRTTLTAGKGIKFLGSHLVNLALHLGLLEFWVRLVRVPELVAPLLVFAVAVPVNYILVRYSMKDKKIAE